MYLGREYFLAAGAGFRGFKVKLSENFFEDMYAEGCLEKAKTVTTPMVDYSERAPQELADLDTTLTKTEHTSYRAIVGKAQWLKQERYDVAFATKCLPHRLSAPTMDDLKRERRERCAT